MPNDLRKMPPALLRVVVLAALMASCVPRNEAPNLRVFAAASTRNVLESAQRTCNIPIAFQFAGSQTLKLQLQHGAQQTFISANAHHIDELRRSGLVDTPKPLARNALTIALGKGLYRRNLISILLPKRGLSPGDTSVPDRALHRDLAALPH